MIWKKKKRCTNHKAVDDDHNIIFPTTSNRATDVVVVWACRNHVNHRCPTNIVKYKELYNEYKYTVIGIIIINKLFHK